MGKKGFLLFLLLSTALLLGACNGLISSDKEGDSQGIWIDAPLNGSQLALAPYSIVVSTSVEGSVEGQTPLFRLLINGQEMAQLGPDYQSGEGESSYVYAGYDWDPATEGAYTIRVELLNQPGPFAEATVYIGELAERDPGGREAEVAEISPTPTSTPTANEFLVVPLRDTNCRLGCSATFFEIADTLFEAESYMPLAMDAQTGFFYFAGPAAGERCWVHESLLDLQLNGASVDLQSVVDSNLVALRGCPANPTLTPTPTSTPEASGGGSGGSGSGGASSPQCNDGVDNDGDGKADYDDSGGAVYLGDLQCSSFADNDEAN